ncbi:hypothetical protein P9112_014605 [Eukaryota sp. TZLM1-RC]
MNNKIHKTNQFAEIKEKSFEKVIFKLKSSELDRMVGVRLRHLFQSILIDGVIDFSSTNVEPSVIDDFVHQFHNSNNLSALISFLQRLNSNELKEKLIEAFTIHLTEPISKAQLEMILGLEIKQELKHKLFIYFISNINSINVQDFVWILNLGNEFTSQIDFESFITKIEFNALSEMEFKTLVDFAIKCSNSWLLGQVVDHYEFGSIPNCFPISSDLLLNLNLSNSINKKKKKWLEGVIVSNCSFDIIDQLCQKLLGRETKFMKFNTNQSGSGMVFLEGNRRVLNDCCDDWKHCNFAAINYFSGDFKVAIKKIKDGDRELIGFWTMDDIRNNRPSNGVRYPTDGCSGNGVSFSHFFGIAKYTLLCLPQMNQGDILYITIRNNRATFSLRGSSDSKHIPFGSVFGIWTRYKGSEYQIVDYHR